MRRHVLPGPAGSVVAFWIVTLAIQAVSYFMLHLRGSEDIEHYWLQWIENIDTHGLIRGYVLSRSDYPPLTFLILAGVTKASGVFGLSHHVGLKVSLWLFLSLAGLAFYIATGRRWLTVGLQASLLLASVGLGYLDVYFAPTLVLTMWAIRERHFTTGLLLYAVTCLIKFQPAIIAPAILLYYWREGQLRPKILIPAALFIAIALIVFGRAPLDGLARAGAQSYLSGLALNFMWIVTHLVVLLRSGQWLPGFTVEVPPVAVLVLKLLFVFIYANIVLCLKPRSFAQLLQSASAASLVYFAFSPGVHENHLIVALVPLAWLAACGQRKYEFISVALFVNVNLLLFYGVSGRRPIVTIAHVDLALALAAVAFVGWIFVDYRDQFAAALRASPTAGPANQE